jgi:hypothetical protein
MGQLYDRMVQDLVLRNFSPATRRNYLLSCRQCVAHFMRSAELIGEDEIRQYLREQIELRRRSYGAYRQLSAALKLLYAYALKRPREVERIRFPRQRVRPLPEILPPATGCGRCVWRSTSPWAASCWTSYPRGSPASCTTAYWPGPTSPQVTTLPGPLWGSRGKRNRRAAPAWLEGLRRWTGQEPLQCPHCGGPLTRREWTAGAEPGEVGAPPEPAPGRSQAVPPANSS